MKRTIFEEDHQLFRETFRQFVEKEMVPHNNFWEQEGIVSREIFEKAGEHGFLGIDLPEEYGGCHTFGPPPSFDNGAKALRI